ncbi:MAG: ATP-dependent Clp protease ATP-binding subunit [Alphaproteobacteria bacterium]|nr:ATP-dependent Clp protease ATP-binding subunit [Alphaproteobacteria bacterium SS10]
MSQRSLDPSTFFSELGIYLEASREERNTDKIDIDDLYYALTLIDEGGYMAQTRTLDQFGLTNDLDYVQQFGRPKGYERPDLTQAIAEAYVEVAPAVHADFEQRMADVIDNLDEGYEAYAAAALDHGEEQYIEQATEDYYGETPPSLHGLAQYLARRIIVAAQKQERASTKDDLPLEITQTVTSRAQNHLYALARDPVLLLQGLEGRGSEVSQVNIRRFAQAVDPDFYRLITARNNTQLANSSAVPESDMPSQQLIKFVMKAQREARAMGDDKLLPKHLFVALLSDDQVQSELNHLNQSARKINSAEIREALRADVDDATLSNDDEEADLTSPEFVEAQLKLDDIFEAEQGKFAASKAVQQMLEDYPELEDALREVGFTDRRLKRWGEISGNELPVSSTTPFKIDEGQFQAVLREFTTDITEQAQNGKLDPIIGRDQELEQIKTILTQRKKKNPIVIGEPGVGKTAMLHAYAQAVVAGDVPDSQVGAKVLELDVAGLVAGTRYRGDFEERLKVLVNGIAERNARGDRPPIILGVDEAHMLVGLGANSGDAQGASQFIKPALQQGDLITMMFTTEDEYRKFIAKDGALERRIQPVKVDEPSPEDTVTILKGLRTKYEDHYDITITDEAIEAVVQLGGRYIHDRNFPDKGLDVIDGAGAAALRDGKETVDREAIIETVARMAKLKKEYLGEEDNARYAALAERLSEDVFGQDQAIEEVALSLAVAKAGLREPHKPIGSYLFVGPTGVGKTELAKSLAKHTSGSVDNLVRIDMSEYMEKHSVSKLIGAPPGYVGYDQEGELVGAIRRNPNSVIVFDEIEKAHPDVQKILLQVMDDGKLTDSQGKTIDFSNSLIVMTSNLGAQAANEAEAKRTIGFTQTEEKVDRTAIMTGEVEQYFSPEFRNRLDGVVPFGELTKDVMAPILDKQIDRLVNQMEEAWGMKLELSDTAKEQLMDEGFDPKMGGRPLKRALNQLVERPLSLWLLKNKNMRDRPGTTLKVDGIGAEFSVTEDKPDQLIDPKRIQNRGPDTDLPGDTVARLRRRREGYRDQRREPPAPAPGKRFG